MSDAKSKTVQGEEGRFSEALRQARLTEAAHFDAVMDIRDAETLRLAALRDDIAPLIAEQPEAKGYIDLALVPGTPPKLWIDMVSYVVMAPNPQTYRLVQDTSQEHEIVHETVERSEMVAKLTEFIAHQMVHRERLIAARKTEEPETPQGYGNAALILAWLSGFSLGILVLFAIGVLLARMPG